MRQNGMGWDTMRWTQIGWTLNLALTLTLTLTLALALALALTPPLIPGGGSCIVGSPLVPKLKVTGT